MNTTIYIMRASGEEHGIIDIPPGKHDADVLCSEFQRALQRAYDLGRKDQAEHLETMAEKFVSEARAMRRGI